MEFSVVIAIFNRKEELFELLNSLKYQSYKNFDVLIIDDGSSEDLLPIVKIFSFVLNIYYYKKPNSGAGLSRNFGANLSKNEYLIFLDSDCIIPEYYLENVHNELKKDYVDAFGGPDVTHKNFNTIQKAMSYSMTSIFTTGGIRGSKISMGKFQLRSFNMGVNRKVFFSVGGFSDLRIGEDSDLSMTLWEKKISTRFFPNAFVYHKRRNTVAKFAKQIYQFGVARPILYKRHPQYSKIIFWLPSLFLIGLILTFLLGLGIFFIQIHNGYTIFLMSMIIFFVYFIVILIHSSIISKDLTVGLFSIITSFIQLNSYGLGFLYSFIKIFIFKKNPKSILPKIFID